MAGPDTARARFDPDEGLGFEDVRKAAFDLRRQLADVSLVCFAMLSGGKGVHVIVPLTPGYDWDAHKDFSRRFAEAMSKTKRKGRIFIDWLRNQRGSTAVMPYSARARSGAPVAAPVGRDELRDIDTAAKFHVGEAELLPERAAGATLKGWGFAAEYLIFRLNSGDG